MSLDNLENCLSKRDPEKYGSIVNDMDRSGKVDPAYKELKRKIKTIGQVPSGFETVEILSRMYTETLGAWTRYLFMIAAFSILYSTYLVNTAGIARIIPDGLRKIGIIAMKTPKQRIFWRRVFLIAGPAVMFLLYFVIGKPAWLIVVGGVIVGLSMPVACVIGIWLNRIMKRQDPKLAQSPTLTGILFVCTAIIMAIQVTWFVIGFLD